MTGYMIVDTENKDIHPGKEEYQYKKGETYSIDSSEISGIYMTFCFYLTIDDCIYAMTEFNNCKNIMEVEILGDVVEHKRHEVYYTNYIRVLNFLDKNRFICALKKKIKNLDLDLLNKKVDEYDYKTIVEKDIKEFLCREEDYLMIENTLYLKNPIDKVCKKVNLKDLKRKMHSDECLHYCLTLDEAQHYIDLNDDLAYKVCEYYGLQNSTSIEIDDAIRNYYIDKWIEKLNN